MGARCRSLPASVRDRRAVGSSLTLRVLPGLAEVPRAAWDRLLGPDATPFERWAWLAALETSGCAAPGHGWVARDPPAPSRGGELIAGAPAYLKADSDGDFSRDWGWAASVERAGLAYYPKLV